MNHLLLVISLISINLEKYTLSPNQIILRNIHYSEEVRSSGSDSLFHVGQLGDVGCDDDYSTVGVEIITDIFSPVISLVKVSPDGRDLQQFLGDCGFLRGRAGKRR